MHLKKTYFSMWLEYVNKFHIILVINQLKN